MNYHSCMSSPLRRRLPIAFIGLTLVACLAALWWRVPLLSLHWARVIATTESSAEQARYLAALCNAGSDGAWGVARLGSAPRADLRQCAAIALQRIHTDWGRAELLRLLGDADADVRAMAALGLAVHGDDRLIPALVAKFENGGADELDAAAAALARIGTPPAVDALLRLAAQPGTAAQRAALIDSLDELREPRGVPLLLEMLDDQRSCAAERRAERRAWRSVDLGATAAAAAGVLAPAPELGADQTTIAARAADALGRITGIPARPPGVSPGSIDDETRAVWRGWSAERQPAPPASRPALPGSP